jgi:hypothetical protein
MIHGVLLEQIELVTAGLLGNLNEFEKVFG